MPEMDGLEFYDRIKDMQHDVKACFMIAGSNSGEDFITKRLPGNNKRVCVAIKPIRLQELILLLNVELEGSNSIDSTIPIISDWQMPSSSQQQKVSPK